MKNFAAVLAALILTATAEGSARADTAVGVEFGYPGNINIDPTFCGGCWWINQSWMNQCPRDFETARCMTEQKPEAVAAAILRALAQHAAAGDLQPAAH